MSEVKHEKANTEVILIPGLFEDVRGGVLKTIEDVLSLRDFRVHRFECFSDLSTESSFSSLLDGLNRKIAEISERDSDVVLIGHSLGAYLALLSGYSSSKICLDVSLHPREIFSHINCANGLCSWSGIKGAIRERFVEDAKNVPDLEEVSSKDDSRTFFFGAEKGGAIDLIIRYTNSCGL